MSVPVAN